MLVNVEWIYFSSKRRIYEIRLLYFACCHDVRNVLWICWSICYGLVGGHVDLLVLHIARLGRCDEYLLMVLELEVVI